MNIFFVLKGLMWIDILKVERMVKMSEMNPQDLTRHEAVDIRFTSNVWKISLFENLTFSDSILRQSLRKTWRPYYKPNVPALALLWISSSLEVSPRPKSALLLRRLNMLMHLKLAGPSQSCSDIWLIRIFCGSLLPFCWRESSCFCQIIFIF